MGRLGMVILLLLYEISLSGVDGRRGGSGHSRGSSSSRRISPASSRSSSSSGGRLGIHHSSGFMRSSSPRHRVYSSGGYRDSGFMGSSSLRSRVFSSGGDSSGGFSGGGYSSGGYRPYYYHSPTFVYVGGHRSHGSGNSMGCTDCDGNSSDPMFSFTDDGIGSANRSSSLLEAIVANETNYVTYEDGKAIINNLAKPIIWNDKPYYWYQTYFKANKSSVTCKMMIGVENSTFSHIYLPDKINRPQELVWGCDRATEYCCGYECCQRSASFKFTSDGIGSEDRSALLLEAVVADKTNYVINEDGKAVLNNGASPVIWDKKAYYWNLMYYPDDEWTITCRRWIGGENTIFGNIYMEDGISRPEELVWGCYAYWQECCGYECCLEPYGTVLICVFYLIAIALFIFFCVFVGRTYSKAMNRMRMADGMAPGARYMTTFL